MFYSLRELIINAIFTQGALLGSLEYDIATWIAAFLSVLLVILPFVCIFRLIFSAIR